MKSKIPRLTVLSFALTSKCHNNCKFCMQRKRGIGTFPKSRLWSLLEEIKELGSLNLCYSGGEPMDLPYLEDVFASCPKGSWINLYTNGTGLTPERMRSLVESGLQTMWLPLYSTIPEVHDKNVGRKGAFRETIESIRAAKKGGFEPGVSIMATKDTIENGTFLKTNRILKQRYNVKKTWIFEPKPLGGLTSREDVVLSRKDRRTLYKIQRRSRRDETLPNIKVISYFEEGAFFGCTAGWSRIHIDAKGYVYPCDFVYLSFGNVLEEPLEKILDRMSKYFPYPRRYCLGIKISKDIKKLNGNIPNVDESIEIAGKHKPGPPSNFYQELGHIGYIKAYRRLDRVYEHLPYEDLLDYYKSEGNY